MNQLLVLQKTMCFITLLVDPCVYADFRSMWGEFTNGCIRPTQSQASTLAMPTKSKLSHLLLKMSLLPSGPAYVTWPTWLPCLRTPRLLNPSHHGHIFSTGICQCSLLLKEYVYLELTWFFSKWFSYNINRHVSKLDLVDKKVMQLQKQVKML